MDVLGYAPTQVQCDAFERLALTNRLLWQSGRRCGKSRFLAGAAAWYYCTRPKCTVTLGAGCERQITEVVWWDLCDLIRNSGVCLACRIRNPEIQPPCPHSTPIDGEVLTSVRTGVRAQARRIFGAAPRTPDRARGTADANTLVLLDEGPAIPEQIAQVHRDNTAGGGKFVTACNPSSRTDWVYKFSKEPGTDVVVASCLDQPNVKFGRLVQPGLVIKDWVDERRITWGEKDPRWEIEVLGQFPSSELSRLITETEFSEACQRGEEMSLESQRDEPLHFGIDPAAGRDQSVISPVRGLKVLPFIAFHGGNDRIMAELDGAIRQYQRGTSEQVFIKYDASAQWGSHLAQELRKYREGGRPWINIEGLEARGDRSKDHVLLTSKCARLRDAYWLNLAGMVKDKLGLYWDAELHDELMLVEVIPDLENGTRVTDQKTFRHHLGHSPDKANALMYAVWRGHVASLSKASELIALPSPPKVERGPQSSYARLRDYNPFRNSPQYRPK